ncbi:GNAT family N-acetyltransferase [Kitasatospora kazusensis]|uniref:GNAT family N-acetyltransferase n=1 Tax=Kitasatospora kazusensis TaxID=407974 RepID=A0ABP5KSL7_9ACTN
MPEHAHTPQVRLRPWSEADLALLTLTNTPEMTAHLGGPEPEEKLPERHRRYLAVGANGTGRMFTVVLSRTGETVGSVGYWEHVWQGETVYETGWGILPPFQGRGLAAAAALAVIDAARAEGRHRTLHAFPSVEHTASNAICRKAGFTLLGEVEFEYPKGSFLQSNDWCVELGGSDL